MNSSKKVALITGATGFVGSHLARRLVSDGWEVNILTRQSSRIPEYKEFSNDIINYVHDGSTKGMIKCMGEIKPNIVFHLAAMIQAQHKSSDIELMVQGNILFGNQLLEAMHINGVTRLVNTGTFWQHYNNEIYNPVCLYAATKQAFESIIEYYVEACNLKSITLELFDTYGPKDHRAKLFNILGNAIRTGASLDLSPGNQHIAPIYIEDVIGAYVVAADRLLKTQCNHHERYAVSPLETISLRDFVQMYLDIAKKNIKINWGARPYRTREVMEPWSGGRWIDNWKPTTSLKEGLRCVINSDSA